MDIGEKISWLLSPFKGASPATCYPATQLTAQPSRIRYRRVTGVVSRLRTLTASDGIEAMLLPEEQAQLKEPGIEMGLLMVRPTGAVHRHGEEQVYLIGNSGRLPNEGARVTLNVEQGPLAHMVKCPMDRKIAPEGDRGASYPNNRILVVRTFMRAYSP